MDLLGAMRVFVRVVDTGSFSAVAHDSHISQPTVTRMIAALENHLGTRLLHRSTRALTLTDDGRMFEVLARRTLDAAAEAESVVSSARGRPAGLLRLSVPPEFGRRYVSPLVTEYLDRYPDTQIELVSSVQHLDLVVDGLDLAVRIGNMIDSLLIARCVGSSRRIAVASADYLTRRGVPGHPLDLKHHECVVHTPHAPRKQWHFGRAEAPIIVDVNGRFASNNGDAVRSRVREGAGITVLPDWSVDDDIRSGQMREVLVDFRPPPVPINAVYSSRRHLSAKVRAMIDLLAAGGLPDTETPDEEEGAPKVQPDRS